MRFDGFASAIALLLASGLAAPAYAANAKCAEVVTGAAVRDASEAKAKDLAVADWIEKSKASAAAWEAAQAKDLTCSKIEGGVFECRAAGKPCLASAEGDDKKSKPPTSSKPATKPPVRRGSGE